MSSEQSANGSTDTAIVSSHAVAMPEVPMIFDLGLRSKKQVKRLRHGDGKLMDGINNVIEELKKKDKIALNAQPIVIIVRERREKGIAALFKT